VDIASPKCKLAMQKRLWLHRRYEVRCLVRVVHSQPYGTQCCAVGSAVRHSVKFCNPCNVHQAAYVNSTARCQSCARVSGRCDRLPDSHSVPNDIYSILSTSLTPYPTLPSISQIREGRPEHVSATAVVVIAIDHNTDIEEMDTEIGLSESGRSRP
jgi:hypothetical protein